VDLDGEMERQALMHGVADAIAGVARLQITDTVYDAQYWADYRAGLAAWRQAEQRSGLPEGYQPRTPPRREAASQPHPDGALAARGWRTHRDMYVHPQAAPAAKPFAWQLLAELQAAGEWAPGGEQQWAAEPPEASGLDDGGPEAG
jgi:hypothetical protein